MKTSNGTDQFTLKLIVIATALLGAYFIFTNIKPSKVPSTERIAIGTEKPSSETSTLVQIGPDAVFVADQRPGNLIVANFVVFARNGYVVIHEVADGVPAAIVGSSAFLTAGNHQNIFIPLASTYDDGVSLIAMLHNDNGDGSFNPKSDPPVRDDRGNIIQMNFPLRADAPDPSQIQVAF